MKCVISFLLDEQGSFLFEKSFRDDCVIIIKVSKFSLSQFFPIYLFSNEVCVTGYPFLMDKVVRGFHRKGVIGEKWGGDELRWISHLRKIDFCVSYEIRMIHPKITSEPIWWTCFMWKLCYFEWKNTAWKKIWTVTNCDNENFLILIMVAQSSPERVFKQKMVVVHLKEMK